MGAVTKEMEKNYTAIRRGRTEIHRDQAIVERFNRTQTERLFGHQYAVEMRLPEGQWPTAWVKRLPEVVSVLNNEVTTLIGKKPAQAIKEKAVNSKPSTPYLRPGGKNEKKLPSGVSVRYLYQPCELEGGGRRATDPIWSLKVFNIERSITKPNEPVLYYLRDGPKRGFVREELLVVPLIPNSNSHLAKDNRVEVIFYRLCVNTIWQHPPLVIIRTQTEFVLLICAYGSSYPRETSICGFIFPSV